MAFDRITDPALTVNNVTALADRPALTSAALKAVFDHAGGDLLVYLTDLADEINALIDEMEAVSAAANLGAAAVWPEDISEDTVQDKLEALKDYIDGLVIAAGAGDMLKSIYDTAGNGKVDVAENAEKLGGALPATFAKEITAQDAKISLVNADSFMIADSGDSNIQKKTLWSSMKSAMQAALATVFAGVTHGHGISDITGVAATAHTHAYASLSGVAAATHAHVYADLTGAAASSHTHTATSVSGFAKNAAGILITVSNSQPGTPTTNDLWFSDEA